MSKLTERYMSEEDLNIAVEVLEWQTVYVRARSPRQWLGGYYSTLEEAEKACKEENEKDKDYDPRHFVESMLIWLDRYGAEVGYTEYNWKPTVDANLDLVVLDYVRHRRTIPLIGYMWDKLENVWLNKPVEGGAILLSGDREGSIALNYDAGDYSRAALYAVRAIRLEGIKGAVIE